MTTSADNSSSRSSSSEDGADRFVLKSKRGWDGDELELEHQRESIREKKEKVSAAVDISQFQNHEVGSGYQAKHVVRQRSANKPTVPAIKDMTRSRSNSHKSNTSSSREDKKRKTDHYSNKNDNDDDNNPKARLKKYLSNPAFVMFRQEIQDILSS